MFGFAISHVLAALALLLSVVAFWAPVPWQVVALLICLALMIPG